MSNKTVGFKVLDGEGNRIASYTHASEVQTYIRASGDPDYVFEPIDGDPQETEVYDGAGVIITIIIPQVKA